MRRLGLSLLLVAWTTMLACGDDTSSETGTAGSGASATTGVTWWGDVAPIVYANCVQCHRDGSIAPWPLVSYEDGKNVAAVMKLATANRTMPPWPADNSGACNTFIGANTLTDEEIATIAAWVDGGTPEGDPALALELPAAPPSLDQVTHTLDPGETYTPSTDEPDDYRCYLVDPGITQDMYLTDFEVKPGDDRVVHHVILYSLDDADTELAAVQLDVDEAGPGYACYGGPRVPSATSRFVAGWAPGTPPTHYPEGTGVPLMAGRQAVLQIHYNTVKGTFPDRTTMDLTVASDVPKPAQIISVKDSSFSLPPGMDYVKAANTVPGNAPVQVNVHGVFPHMHELGVDVNVSIVRGGNDVCLVDIPRWNFNWQQFYLFEEPVVAMPGDDISIRCGFNTESRTTTTTWGDGTQDEMCIAFLYVSPM
jgi:hypothetical protein